MDIKAIAEQVSKRIYVEDGLLLSKFISEKFAEALIESYKAELLKEVGEPVAHMIEHKGKCMGFLPTKEQGTIPVFTSDQVAAAILKATKLLKDSLAVVKKDRADLYMETLTLRDQLAKIEQLWQVAQGRCDGLEEKLAKAEQRVAEACAYLAHQHMDADIAADAINNGEWRKFVKEM